MAKEDKPKTIYEALALFSQKVGAIKKVSTNPHFKSKYADLNEVLDVISEPLNECGLMFIQTPQADGLKTVIRLIENSEETIHGFIPFIGISDMQKLGSALTYCRRYSLVTMLRLEQEDDDGNNAVKPKEQPKPKEPTLGDYLESKGVKWKPFYDHYNIKTAEQSKAILLDKAGLDALITEYKNAQPKQPVSSANSPA